MLARLPLAQQREFGLAGGDDYELLFTAPAGADARVQAAAAGAGCAATRIGHVTAEPGLVLLDARGAPLPLAPRGFDHFAG